MVLTNGQLTRRRLESAPGETLRRNGWNAGLWTATFDGCEVLVKDVRSSKWLYRWTIGRFLLAHEGAIYERLSRCSFVPQFLGWLDSDAFALRRVPSTSLGSYERPLLTPEFYDRLRACVDRLHAEGIVHFDLRSRRNILVTSDGQPMLIDFANAVFIGRSWLSRLLLVPLLGCIDRSAILKFRHRDFPELLSGGERMSYMLFRCWRLLWPFGRLWRALGLNHARKRNRRRRAAQAERPHPQPS
jgi:predicted Ser/Thr protein kinase